MSEDNFLGGRPEPIPHETLQFARTCKTTITRMTPANSVVAAMKREDKCARTMANDFCDVSGRTMSRLRLRNNSAQPLTSTTTGRPNNRNHNVHIRPAYHMTSC